MKKKTKLQMLKWETYWEKSFWLGVDPIKVKAIQITAKNRKILSTFSKDAESYIRLAKDGGWFLKGKYKTFSIVINGYFKRNCKKNLKNKI